MDCILKIESTRSVFSTYVFLLLLVLRLSSVQSHSLNQSTGHLAECNEFLSSSLETIYSPDYPNASPLKKTCSWQIIANHDKHIAIQLMEMNVGGSDWDCRMGYLEIYDGCGEDRFLVDKICTSRYQNNQRYLWVSTGPCVVIKFNSAHGSENKFYLKTRQTSFSCNKVFHDQPNGTFSNPVSLPLEQQECTWVLAVPRNKIELKFKGDFQIQRNSGECKDDFITVQNGRFSSSSVIGTYCGHTRPYPVSSRYGDMRITLRSNGRTAGSKNIFNAIYSMKNTHDSPTIQPNVCGSPAILEQSHASFVSPGYPDQYPPHMNCVWLIKVKPKLKILLRFKDFDVEGNNENCDDYVEIFDGLASWSPVKGRYCGRDIPPVIRSENNKLRLVFKSNSHYAGRGFDAVYSDYDPSEVAKSTSSSTSHFTGIMIGTTCGIIFIVLSVFAVFHARKRRMRRALEQRSEMASTMSFDVHQANAPPSYEKVMASPNLYPTLKGESDLTRDYDGVPGLHHEVCHLLGSNPDSDDEEPPPAYHGLFGDEGDVHAYGPIDGHFTVQYHRHSSQDDQAQGINHETEKPGESKPSRVWQRRDFDQSRSSINLPGSHTGTLERPKETGTRPTLERQDTRSSFVTDV